MNQNFMNLVLGAFEAAAEQQHLYDQAFAEGGGKIAYATAVDLAADRLKRAFEITSKDASKADFLAGLLAAESYKSVDQNWQESHIVRMIDDAKASYWAFLALKAVAVISLENSVMLPSLKRWLVDLLKGDIEPPVKPRGPSPYEKVHRDALIAGEVKRLQRFGFNPTRAKAGAEATSGCDIIADALGKLGQRISYAAVETIWTKRTAQPYPTLVAAAMSILKVSR